MHVKQFKARVILLKNVQYAPKVIPLCAQVVITLKIRAIESGVGKLNVEY